MAANSTVFRAELQVSDMDRHYYAGRRALQEAIDANASKLVYT